MARMFRQLIEEHDFYTVRKTQGIIDLGSRKDASTPSARPLPLNRLSIHKYTLPRHLSPLKGYSTFNLEGHLRLAKATVASCNATLRFEISAYEWVWALVVIDDGYRSNFIPNGITSTQSAISSQKPRVEPQFRLQLLYRAGTNITVLLTSTLPNCMGKLRPA